MKQQVVVIAGGTSFDTHEDYIQFLKTRELTKERLRHSFDWKASLAKELGDGFEVLVPKMPNTTNARYAEWCMWFERCAEFFTDNVVLVGHSMGGIFLAKYLSEHDASMRIKATVLIAAPFDDNSQGESLRDFALPASLDKFSAQGGAIYLVQSEDDPVVPFGELKKYQELVPAARPLIFSDRGHFNQEIFPELVQLLTSL